MPETTLENPQISAPIPGQAEDSPAWAALVRPQRLKSWSSDLVAIVDGQAEDLFTDWSFRPGALTRHDFGHILRKISGCGSVLELRAAVDHSTGDVGAPVLHAANFCGQHTICPFCAGRVQDRRLAKWEKPIKWAAQKFRFAYMITATTAPAETWRADIDGLRDAWRGFYLKGQKRIAGRSPGEWGKVKAGIAKMEIKRGEDSHLPHCHYHALVFTDEMLNYEIWSKEERAKWPDEKDAHKREPNFKIPWPVTPADSRGWRAGSKLSHEWSEATGFTAMGFRVDPIRWKPEHKREGVSFAESVYYQSIEVLKYSTKFDSSPATGAEKLFARDFIGIKDATYNRRLFHTYGFFHRDARKAINEVCPFLLDEDDFTGGGPQIYDGPLIYESRWRDRKYSELESRSKPVFKGQERTLTGQFRRTMLNRVQGKFRRMRTAIVESKKIFAESGDLVHAAYMQIDYDAPLDGHGRLVQRPAEINFPAYVLENPEDFSNWERWIDSLSESFKVAYQALQDFFSMDSETRFEDQFRAADAARYWEDRSKGYQDEVIRAFLEVLNSPEGCARSAAPS